MKLKEKLSLPYCECGIYDCSKRTNYIAGFEAARDLAQTRFVSKVMVRPKHSEEPDTFNTVVVNGDRFEFTMLEDFKSLGEQEVD